MSSKHVSPKLHEERLRKEFVDEKAKEAADRQRSHSGSIRSLRRSRIRGFGLRLA